MHVFRAFHELSHATETVIASMPILEILSHRSLMLIIDLYSDTKCLSYDMFSFCLEADSH